MASAQYLFQPFLHIILLEVTSGMESSVSFFGKTQVKAAFAADVAMVGIRASCQQACYLLIVARFFNFCPRAGGGDTISCQLLPFLPDPT